MHLETAARIYSPVPGSRVPLAVEKLADGEQDVLALVGRHRDQLSELLLKHGALLFRGFAVNDAATFGRFLDAISEKRLDYVYRSTPRKLVGDRVFTSTAYPPALEIPLHQENAYQREWPMKLALCCLVPATSGGETPLADMVRVTARLPAELLDRFEERGVCYVRHYHEGTDLPWQTVFQTDDREVLANYCRDQGIDHVWLDENTLRTSQQCQGIAYHPVTGDRLFFNQAHLFHVSNLGDVGAKALIEVFGADRLPRNATFADGAEIDASDLQLIRNAYASEAVAFPWQAGDVVVVDNMQVAHGRRPFKGKREVLAGMSDPFVPSADWQLRPPGAGTVVAPSSLSHAE